MNAKEIRFLLLNSLSLELGTIQLPNTTALQPAIWVGEPPFNSKIVGLECNIQLFPSTRTRMNITNQVQSLSLIQHDGATPKIDIARTTILHIAAGISNSVFLPATTLPDGKKTLDTVKFYFNETVYCPPTKTGLLLP